MTAKPMKPNRQPLPKGFVDALGLDDGSIAVVPRIIKRRARNGPAAPARTPRAPAQKHLNQ